MKRIIAFLLAMMCLFSLAACSSSETAPQEATADPQESATEPEEYIDWSKQTQNAKKTIFPEDRIDEAMTAVFEDRDAGKLLDISVPFGDTKSRTHMEGYMIQYIGRIAEEGFNLISYTVSEDDMYVYRSGSGDYEDEVEDIIDDYHCYDYVDEVRDYIVRVQYYLDSDAEQTACGASFHAYLARINGEWYISDFKFEQIPCLFRM